jgi:hypothetical protein
MPGFGAERQFARGQSVPKKIKTLTVRFPEESGNGETRVEHEHMPPHSAEQFRFSAHEGDALKEHLMKHVGLNLPGKAASGESMESVASKSDSNTE